MEVVYHSHAVERMQERDISVEEVNQLIHSPDGKIRQTQDKWILYKRFRSRKDNLIAAVVVEWISKESIEVITVLVNFEVRK